MTEETSHNRELWNGVNTAFTDSDGERRWQEPDLRWGLFARPEADLALLGDVAGLDVVELGCGTAALSGRRWCESMPVSILL